MADYLCLLCPPCSRGSREPFDIVRGVHQGLKLLAGLQGRDAVVSAIKAVEAKSGDDDQAVSRMLAPLLALVQQARSAASSDKERATLDSLEQSLRKSATLHVAANLATYQDGLVRFIGTSNNKPRFRLLDRGRITLLPSSVYHERS